MSDNNNSNIPVRPSKDLPRPIKTVCTSSLDKKPQQPLPNGEKR